MLLGCERVSKRVSRDRIPKTLTTALNAHLLLFYLAHFLSPKLKRHEKERKKAKEKQKILLRAVRADAGESIKERGALCLSR